MMMVMVTIMVNVCDDDCYLVMKVILVKEVISCDVSPVAMFCKGFPVRCVLIIKQIKTLSSATSIGVLQFSLQEI